MSETVTLAVYPGQLALVLSADGVNAFNHWQHVYGVFLKDDEGRDALKVQQALNAAAHDLVLHVRAAAAGKGK